MAMLPAVDPFGAYGGLGGFGGDPLSELMSMGFPILAGGTFPTLGTARTRGVDYPMDIEETEKSYVITADAPGLHAEDVTVDVSDDRILTIKGEQQVKQRKRDERLFSRIERGRRTFTRQFSLPDALDVHGVHAHLENGILKVTVNKLREAQRPPPRKVPVRGGSRADRGADVQVHEAGAEGTEGAGAGGADIGATTGAGIGAGGVTTGGADTFSTEGTQQRL